jgi:hypothetical protein
LNNVERGFLVANGELSLLEGSALYACKEIRQL